LANAVCQNGYADIFAVIKRQKATVSKQHNKPITPGALQADSRFLHYVTRFVVILVAVGAAILSFDALTALAQASGIRQAFAPIWAIVIDGFIMVATLATFALQNRSKSSRRYAWTTLAIFVVFSILGNAWHAAISKTDFVLPIWVSVIVTAIPPLALFLAIHLLVIMVSPTQEQKEEFVRQANKRERLRKLEEKELEKAEKDALAKEIREATAVAKRIANTVKKEEPVNPKPANSSIVPTAEPTSLPTANLVKEVSNQEPEKPTLAAVENLDYESEDEFLTEAQAMNKLRNMLENNEPLPTGKAVAVWLGKSERTGQNLVKKFKSELEVA
jgi:hypothetical protein